MPRSGSSLRRSRLACESRVRVRPGDSKPQTSRRSSSFVKTRCGSRRQHPQQLELLVGELDLAVADADLARRRVDAEQADPDRAAARPGTAVEQLADPLVDLVVEERLDDVVVGPLAEAADAVAVAAAAAQGDDRQRRVEGRRRAARRPGSRGSRRGRRRREGRCRAAARPGFRSGRSAAPPRRSRRRARRSGRPRGSRRAARCVIGSSSQTTIVASLSTVGSIFAPGKPVDGPRSRPRTSSRRDPC